MKGSIISALRLLETCMRCMLTEDCIADLVTPHIYYDVGVQFARKHPRRMQSVNSL